MNKNNIMTENEEIKCGVSAAALGAAAVSPAENIKGTLFRWTDDSAVWYEEASVYTGYHDRLTELIAPHLEKSYTCCELACGTGTLARHLAPYVASYTANDIDHHATDHLAEMTSDGSCPNLEIITGDWHEVLRGRSFNAAVFSFFGAVEQDWETLKKLVSDKIIVVSPRHREGRMKIASDAAEKENALTEQASDPEKPRRIIHGKMRSFETGPSIAAFLDKNGTSYIRKDCDLEFGQPFHDREQARAYTRYYYKLDENDIDYFLDKKLVRRDDGTLYFPKKKKLSVIVIDMRSV